MPSAKCLIPLLPSIMPHDSPLRKLHETYVTSLTPPGKEARAQADRPGAARGQMIAPPEVEYLPYGCFAEGSESICQMIASFGGVEAEYAAMKRGAGLMDSVHRSVLMVTGADRRDFLNRMLTQELKDFQAGMVRQAFWLNRKGRIDADLRLIEFGEFIIIDVDVCQIEQTMQSLNEFIIIEDVRITNAGDSFHRISMHGPGALEALAIATDTHDLELDNLHAISLALDANGELFVARVDQTGEIGLELFVPRDYVERVWTTLLKTNEVGAKKRRVRPIGWYAFNIARIEAGTPLFNIDFGPTNLPHESGVLSDRVSFTKGCYLGQEIVARIESLGKPKRMLVGLKMGEDRLPVEGAAIYEKDGDQTGDQVGVVTSSTLSPMLGMQSIAFGMLQTSMTEMGSTVLVESEGERVSARVHELRFLLMKSDSSNQKE